MQFSCSKCGKVIDYSAAAPVGKRDVCPKCDADLHCCKNCRHYDPAKHNQCAEPQAEWVRDKDAANHCDYFSPNPVLLAQGSNAPAKADDVKKKFDSLFKA